MGYNGHRENENNKINSSKNADNCCVGIFDNRI